MKTVNHLSKLFKFGLSNEDVLKNLDSVLGDIDRNISRDVRITVKIPKELVRFIVPKGSIALDGISLTVAHIENDLCTVALIPQTLDRTTLGKLNKGDHINVETDVMVRSLCNQPVS